MKKLIKPRGDLNLALNLLMGSALPPKNSIFIGFFNFNPMVFFSITRLRNICHAIFFSYRTFSLKIFSKKFRKNRHPTFPFFSDSRQNIRFRGAVTERRAQGCQKVGIRNVCPKSGQIRGVPYQYNRKRADQLKR